AGARPAARLEAQLLQELRGRPVPAAGSGWPASRRGARGCAVSRTAASGSPGGVRGAGDPVGRAGGAPCCLMARYQVMYWKHIPSQVKVWDETGEVKRMLPVRFMTVVESYAMGAG